MIEAIWRAVFMQPGLPELGKFNTLLDCEEAADYAAHNFGAHVECFLAVML